jgi:hypothetical protein
MAEFNPLAEGWSDKGIDIAAPAERIARRQSGPVYHYFAGMAGLGGRFRSLCNRSTIDVKHKLMLDPLQSDYRTKVPICRICAEKVMIANQQSSPRGADIL